MPLEGERRLLARHPLAVVFDGDQLLAAELDLDGEPARAGVDGVLDQLPDDRRRPLDDLAGRDLVGELRRQTVNPAHNQSSRRNIHSMPAQISAMMAAIHQNCAPGPPGNSSNLTFMPNTPVSTVSGMKMVEMTVSTFMT